jgi:predicted transcriptional regulator
MDQQPDQARFVELAAEIVSAYVSKNRVQPADLSRLIGEVHEALTKAEAQASGEPAKPEQPKASPQEIRRSITPDHLVSFEDGKRYKTLRRHLSIRGLTPQAYREKWGLSVDYPMVAANYARQRSELARALGLGQQRRGGLAKLSAQDALKVEAFEEAAESPAGETSDDQALKEVAAAREAATTRGKPKRASKPRAGRRKGEPAPA